MIRNHPLAVGLITLILLLGLFACWCVGWWYLGVRELQGLKYQYQAMTRTTSAMQSLANDAIEYSRRAPSIDPILQQFELKPHPAASPLASPPGAKESPPGSVASPVRRTP
jgi:hypothetical protein